MQEQVKATFLVNAAVLLEFRGTKLLIDGIYDENGHCFSNLSERQWEKLKAGEGEFAGIEYLLFTHEHGDHFSPQRVAEYLEYRQPKAIFMPRDGSAALRALQKKAEGWGFRVFCCIGNYAGKPFFARSRRFVFVPSRPDIWISFTGMCRISAIY